MNETRRNLKDLPLFDRAEMALREAVAEVIEARRRAGEAVVTWRDGKVVLVSPDELAPPTGTNGAS